MDSTCRNPEVYDFLHRLQVYLNATLPPIKDVAQGVEAEAQSLFCEGSPYKEPAFISRFITPQLHRFLTCHNGFDEKRASHAIISENIADRKRGYANKSARTAYPFTHPFGKTIGASATEIVTRWYGAESPLSSKHPDLCVTEPHRILFEIKYLTCAGGRTDLIKTVYEAFFYLGLAPVVDGNRPWTYEYAVALIYDGTHNATLLKAWAELRSDVRAALWNSANVFVMPLRGTEA
jgi:hypothetical protein